MKRFEQWIEADVFSGLDVELARMLLRRFGEVGTAAGADPRERICGHSVSHWRAERSSGACLRGSRSANDRAAARQC